MPFIGDSADSCVNPCDWSVHFDFLMLLGHLGSKEHHLIGCEFGRPFNPILGGKKGVSGVKFR